jgi:hypothetical protein
MKKKPTKSNAAPDLDGHNREMEAASAAGNLLWWRDLLTQIFRECLVRNIDAKVPVSVPRAFLRNNSVELSDPIEIELIDKLRQASMQDDGLTSAGFRLPSSGADDAAYVSRIRRLVVSYDVLTTSNFGVGFQKLVAEADPPVTIGQLALRTGLEAGKIRYALKAQNGCTGLDAKDICRMDEVLGSTGKLIALYAALSQHVSLKNHSPAMNEVLNLNSFGALLRRKRIALELTLSDVSRAMAAVGIPVSDDQLCGWECEYNKPPKEMSQAVLALDEMLRCDGILVISWDEQTCRGPLPPYALRFSDWPPKLQTQFELLAEFKQREYCNTPGLSDPGHWASPASKSRALETLERIFGFLLNNRCMPREALSMTLIADFTLITAFFDFVRNRMSRDDYSYDAEIIARVIKNWYVYYYPDLLDDACDEEYWIRNMPKEAEGVHEVVPGVSRPYKRELTSIKARWRYQIFAATGKCTTFLKSGKFSRANLGKSAEPLFKHPGALSQMAEILADQIHALSGRVSCVDAAIHVRRLTQAVVLIARCFRPETLLSLQMNHADIHSDGRVWLDVPPELYKQKGQGGSKLGFHGYLADFDYMHEVVRRYINDARPFLVGDPQARGHHDAGYLFTPACNENRRNGVNSLIPGGPLSHELLRRDVRSVLGYAPYAQRHVFSTEALFFDLISDEAAEVLANTSRMIDLHYNQGRPEFKMEVANRGIETLLFG